MVSRYSDAKIYKIVNDIDDQIYVGSTILQLNIRFTKHIYASKLYPERKLYKHFTKLGVEHFKIILIKNYPCNNKTELAIEEERYKLMLNAQLNTYRAHQTAEQKKEQQKERNDRNNKIYYQNNRAKLLLKKKERLLCKVCGKTYTRHNKARHCRSNHHQNCVHLNQSKNATNEKFNKCVQFNNSIQFK